MYVCVSIYGIDISAAVWGCWYLCMYVCVSICSVVISAPICDACVHVCMYEKKAAMQRDGVYWVSDG